MDLALICHKTKPEPDRFLSIEGAHGVMVIVVANRHVYTSSIPG